MLFWYVNQKYINMFFISISLIDFGVGFVTPLMLLIETACLATMLRLGFKRRAAWEQTPPLRLRQNFLGYCTALFWFVAVNLTWLNWSAVRIFFSSDPFGVSLAFGSLALFLILNSWVAWKSCRMTYELALALCRHQRQYGYATLAGWLSIVPGVNFLIWLILLVRLCFMELPRGFRRWIAIAIALILLTPGLWLLTVPWIWSGCFLAIGAFAAGVLTRGIVYARPDVAAPFPADCRRHFVRWITPAAVLIGMAVASWVAFSIYTHWCHIRARLAFAAQGISVADNKAPGANDAYPVFQELAACWRSEYVFRLDPLKNIQTGLFLLKELPAGVENALTLTLDHHAETIRLLDSILLPEQSLRFNVRHLWKSAPECAILTDLLQLEQLRLLRAMQNGDTEEIRHIWQQMETLHYWLVDNALIPAKFDYAGKWTWQMAHEPILNRWHFSDEVLQEQLEATMRMEAHLIKQWKHMWAREAVTISHSVGITSYRI